MTDAVYFGGIGNGDRGFVRGGWFDRVLGAGAGAQRAFGIVVFRRGAIDLLKMLGYAVANPTYKR